jgi:Na+-driven multidrug efflux pump
MRFRTGPKAELRLDPVRDLQQLPTLWTDPEKRSIAVDIAGLGTSAFVMQFTNSLVSIVCNSTLSKYGGEVMISVYTIINSVRQVLETPVIAIGEGTSPVISYNYGARRPGHVRKAMLLMSCLGIGYTLIVWLLIERFPGFFISMFSTDAALMKDAIPALHLYFFAFVFQSLQYTGQTTFKALGKKKQAIFFSLFRKAILVVPLTYMFAYPLGMGTDGVFLAEPVSNLIGGVACYITMWFTVYRKLGREQDI